MKKLRIDPKSSIVLFRNGSRLRQAVAGVLACAMLPMSLASAVAQGFPPPPPETQNGGGTPYQPLAPEQIDSLVAPIALYPDSLVAQVLAAATYPQQVVSAEQLLQQNNGASPEQLAEIANQQLWDPSVKGLVAFPQVVSDLNRNLDWTTQLGNAYYNQPQDVLSAVQVMRQRAYAAGNLRSGSQLNVQYAPDDIVIAPVSPTVVYVPYYNPWVVYGAPIPVYPHYYYGPPAGVVFGAGLALGFGVGLAIGAFSHFGWGFHSWGSNWGSRTIVYNHNTYISRSNTVFNHGNYGGFDRAPQARAFNQVQNVRYGGENHTTINNVTVNRGGNTTINRGGNTFNNGGNTVNRGGQTINRGGQTFQNGGQTYNRGGQTVNNGGQTLNRGGQAYNNGGNTVNRGGQTVNRGANPVNNGAQTYNRGAQTPTNTQQFGRQAPGGQVGPQNQSARPGGGYGGPQNGGRLGSNSNQGGAQASQQRSAPQGEVHGSGGGGHESHGGGGGGGHEEHGGGGHR